MDSDAGDADLGLGLVDATVMASAERHGPVLTIDVAHLRAPRPEAGYWRPVVDAARSSSP